MKMAGGCLSLVIIISAASFMQDNVFANPITADQSLYNIYRRLERLEKLESFYAQQPTAFSAVLQYNGNLQVNGGDHIPFDGILENTGDAFKDGHFTAPINGLYAFDVHFTDGDGVQSAYLCKNGAQVRLVFADSGGRYASSSVFSIMELNTGDVVDVRPPSGGTKIIGYEQSAFSGYLIRPYFSNTLEYGFGN